MRANPVSRGIPETTLIGVLGDTHGDMEHVLAVSKTMWARGVEVLLVLGDFGFIWPRENWGNSLDRLSKRLSTRGQRLYFVDGNHEDFESLYGFEIGDDGLRWLRPNIVHIPRGYRTTLASGLTLAALGGANSVDASYRVVGRSIWVEESITEDDLISLGTESVDLLIGHDAPLNLPTLDKQLAATNHLWPKTGVAYSDAGRRMFHCGFLQVRPQLYLGGHYHQHVDDTVEYATTGEPFTSRVVILDMNGKTDAISQAILDVRSLKLQFFSRDDATVTELTGTEAGVWHVHTLDSIHQFDFVARTIERQPGPETFSTIVNHPQPFREIENCRVGERGFWTVTSHDKSIDHTRHSSSQIVKIERVKGTQ